MKKKEVEDVFTETGFFSSLSDDPIRVDELIFSAVIVCGSGSWDGKCVAYVVESSEWRS